MFYDAISQKLTQKNYLKIKYETNLMFLLKSNQIPDFIKLILFSAAMLLFQIVKLNEIIYKY